MSKRRVAILGSSLVVALALVLGLATSMGGSSEAQGEKIAPLDNFLGYQARQIRPTLSKLDLES